MKQLAAAVGETSTGAARRIGGLERAGLVTRRVDPEDHRRSEIALTPTGEAAITTLLKHIFDNQPVENIGSKIRPVSFHPEESRGRR
ncbi:MarR family winged helix-turn-helix transcriptional regulator [Sphingomonas cannabina]|uniref:MarR family winged helix-turn-helix transcriptional regulator n=1 Tax=Sphingomonas cannabina TaxID=2899123 RepID=UPI001F490270|nr:MarR family winged helix-turn-helix transcriptional regulator [Sphingomonas cannabina]UIJ44860.1 MarR family winged helix-turn-helix transcriptional regulator [Sphingomonas cannabina]